MKRFLAFLTPALLVFPMMALAQEPNPGAVTNYVEAFQDVVSAIVPFLVALAVLAILFGLARYAFAAGDENAQKQGRQIMVTGVIILFVMVALWGFVNILLQFFFSGNPSGAPDDLEGLVPNNTNND